MELLAQAARDLLGLELSASQLAQFQLYYSEMTARNEQINLTAITEYDAVQIRHFLDSLTVASPALRGDNAKQVFKLDKAALIDIGAGAGFPGLPLKILYPQLRLTLVESVGKKAAFLSEMVAKLELANVTVLTNRAEEVGQLPEHRATYNVATARAVAAPGVLAEYCLPLTKIGGLVIALKKGEISSEVAEAKKAIQELGGRLRTTPTFRLPTDEPEVQRRLLVIEKIKRTPPQYPRRIGIPAKTPL